MKPIATLRKHQTDTVAMMGYGGEGQHFLSIVFPGMMNQYLMRIETSSSNHI